MFKIDITDSQIFDEVFYHYDYTGNVSYTTDSLGNIKSRMLYIPYGEVTVAGRNDTGFKFNTHEHDKTGLTYFNARYYDSDTGRFITLDPTIPDPTNSQAFNRYMFVNGNPISLIDANGYESESGGTNATSESAGEGEGGPGSTPSGGAPGGVGAAIGNAVSSVFGAIGEGVSAVCSASGAKGIAAGVGGAVVSALGLSEAAKSVMSAVGDALGKVGEGIQNVYSKENVDRNNIYQNVIDFARHFVPDVSEFESRSPMYHHFFPDPEVIGPSKKGNKNKSPSIAKNPESKAAPTKSPNPVSKPSGGVAKTVSDVLTGLSIASTVVNNFNFLAGEFSSALYGPACKQTIRNSPTWAKAAGLGYFKNSIGASFVPGVGLGLIGITVALDIRGRPDGMPAWEAGVRSLLSECAIAGVSIAAVAGVGAVVGVSLPFAAAAPIAVGTAFGVSYLIGKSGFRTGGRK